MATKQKQTHIVHRDLPCKLSDGDRAELSDAMAKAELSIEALKAKVTELNAEKRGLEGHRNGLAHDVDEGTQDKSIECHWVEDLKQNVKRLIRQDTKEEVEKTALTADDLQEKMPGTDKPAGKGGNVTSIDNAKGSKGKPQQ